jgi:GWxTD domain-containing protein
MSCVYNKLENKFWLFRKISLYLIRSKINKMKTLKLYVALMGLLLSAERFMGTPEASFDYKFFYIPGQGSYIETYLEFNGQSLIYKPAESGALQASLQIIQYLKDGEKIIDFLKTNLVSPECVDSSFNDFIDVRRMNVPDGKFTIEIELVDLNDPNNKPVSLTENIMVKSYSDKTFISDIQLVTAYKTATETTEYTKSGIDVLPFVSNYFYPELNELFFYAEIYNTKPSAGLEGQFLLKEFIESDEDSKVIDGFQKISKKDLQNVSPIFDKFDISNLYTGNYNLVVQAIDRNNIILSEKKLFFQRNKTAIRAPISDYLNAKIENTFVENIEKDILLESIYSLRPIADDGEISILSNQMSEKTDYQVMKSFYYSFWIAREIQEPEKASLLYQEQVEVVNKKYGTQVKKGYETDQGRIYLKYGPPTDVTIRANEPSSYPYEIWRYYRANQFNNVRFVFYDRSLLNSNYELLHSDNIPTEIRNPRWELILQSRNTPTRNVDDTQGINHFGGRAKDYFDNPR